LKDPANNPSSPDPARNPAEVGTYLARYAAVIVKNIVGWVLILSAILVGGVFPGPLGTPVFLIGFALISLPGKRRLTSGALRGKPINIHTHKAHLWRLAASLILPPAVVWVLAHWRHPIVHPASMGLGQLCGMYAGGIAAAWLLTWGLLLIANFGLRLMPIARRRVRPWLRRHGVNLLPPRRKPRLQTSNARPDDNEILAFGPKQERRKQPRENPAD
jgi:hypothetical protein